MVNQRFVGELPLQPLSDHRDFVKISTARHRLVHDDLGMAAKVVTAVALVGIVMVQIMDQYASAVGTTTSHLIATTKP